MVQTLKKGTRFRNPTHGSHGHARKQPKWGLEEPNWNQPMLQKGEIGWLGYLGSCGEPWSSYDERCVRMSLMLHVRSPDFFLETPHGWTAGRLTHLIRTLRCQTFLDLNLYAAGLAFGCFFLVFLPKKFVIRFCGSFLHLCTINGQRRPVKITKASVRGLPGQML